ncbi:MAG: hypothetical protein IPH76_10625 [Xanthomonadales bacterium]|nr:hypothetical protein [Xanthomonadales bacterium]
MRLEPYSYEVTEHSCSERGFKRQGGWEGPLVIVDAGEATIVDQATVDADLRVQAQLATDAAITAQRSEENLAPLKRRIGTKLCRDHKSMTFIGYTEAVSPDLDRIQIRVVAQTFGPPKHQPVPDYRPEIIWDAPINWRLCE